MKDLALSAGQAPMRFQGKSLRSKAVPGMRGNHTGNKSTHCETDILILRMLLNSARVLHKKAAEP